MNEYTYHIYSPTRSFGSQPRFLHRDDLAKEGFHSLYGVPKDVARAVEEAGTTAQFKGVVWSERLWLDFDSYDQADEAAARLDGMGVDYVAYDSGGRGYHFGLLRTSQPSHLLPAQDKQWAATHFPDADSSIYTHLHLFRLPGTKHEKTGRTKALVQSRPGKSLSLPPLSRREVHVGSVQASPSSNQSIFDCFRVMANTVPEQNGRRHPTLVKLAYALRDDAGVSADVALWWLNETNKLFSEPKSEEECEGIIKRIFSAAA